MEVKQSLEQTLGGDPQNNDLYSLLEQADYKFKFKKSFNEFYVKKGNFDKDLVLIDTYVQGKGIHQYAFAEVKPGKLEEFCRRFNDYKEDSLTLKGFLVGAATGAITTIIGEGIYYLVKGAQTFQYASFLDQIIPVSMMGMICGAFLIGYPYDLIRSKRNNKKLVECCSMLELKDKEALEWAFI